jgi:hypothetical protein
MPVKKKKADSPGLQLRRLVNGQFRVLTKAQAEAAFERMLDVEEEISAIRKETGLAKLEMESVELKRAATRYMDHKNVEALPVKGKIARLIRSVNERKWLGTKADVEFDTPRDVKPLRSIVSKEMWMKISKRVPDPDKINEAVAAGELDEAEIQTAYYETQKAPYVRLFDQ